MEREVLLALIVEVTCEELCLEPEKVTLEAAFTADLGADSLDIVDLVIALEHKLGIRIPDEDLRQIYRVRECLYYVEKHLSLVT